MWVNLFLLNQETQSGLAGRFERKANIKMKHAAVNAVKASAGVGKIKNMA